MKSSFVLVAVALSVSSLVGCGAPVAEEDSAGEGAAYTGGAALTSPIPSGLYTDGHDNYLRASVAGLAAGQRLQWAFDGAKGAGASELVGMPPLAYVTHWRLELARRSLRETDRTLASIAADVGYDSEFAFAFSRAFKRRLGASPAHYRRGASQA